MGMIVITQYKTDSVECFTNNQKSHAYHKGLSEDLFKLDLTLRPC